MILGQTAEGYKIVLATGTVSNAGTAAADMSTTVTIPEVNHIKAVIGVYTDGNAAGAVVTGVSGNTVDVTVLSVAAGATATVYVIVIADI